MSIEEVQTATLTQVLCSSVRLDNAQALCDRYCQLTGMSTWVVWSVLREGGDRFSLMHQGQLNSLRLEEPLYRLIYCSDRAGWIVPLDEIEPHCEYGHVQLTPAGRLRDVETETEQEANREDNTHHQGITK